MEKTNIQNLDPKVKFFETKTIGISGMTCDKCVATIDKALRAVDGVSEVRVDRAAGTAQVRFDNRKTDIPALHDIILKRGYTLTRSLD